MESMGSEHTKILNLKTIRNFGTIEHMRSDVCILKLI